MSLTPNLEITHIEENQNNKETTANEGFDFLDGAVAGMLSVDCTGVSADITLTKLQALRNLVIATTGALAGAINVIVPDNRKAYLIWNAATGFNITFKTAAGGGVTLAPAETRLLYCSGVDVLDMVLGGSTGGLATEKTSAILDGLGGTTVISIGANILLNSDVVYVNGAKLKRTDEYTITESVPASGNYDQITPAFADALPAGTRNIEILYY